MKTHRELYPEQYQHSLVGKKVSVKGKEGTVTRVVSTRFGMLAILDENAAVAYAVGDCKEKKDCAFEGCTSTGDVEYFNRKWYCMKHCPSLD